MRNCFYVFRAVAAQLIVMAGFAVGSAAALAKEPLTLLGLAFPEKIAGTQRGSAHDFEKTNPGLGHGVEYLRSGWKINVYVYDLRRTSISDDLQSEVVKSQLAQAKGDILSLQKSGTYSKIELRREFSIADARKQPRFLCASYSFVHSKTGEVDSLLCLTSWKNKFVKFRLTTPRRSGAETEAARFVGAWSGLLWPSR